MFMMTHRNSDVILGPDIHFKAAAALYPVCWRFNHVPDADFTDLVDANIRIMVGDADDYDGGGGACQQLKTELAAADAAHISVRVFPGATHIFDTFTEPYEFNDPRSNRRKGASCTSDQIRRRVGRRARTSSHSLQLNYFLNKPRETGLT